MTATRTETETYTRADVNKVFERFRSDYRMAARSTQLITEEAAAVTAEDVIIYAEAGFISAVHIVLYRADGFVRQAEEYLVTEEASSLVGSRPGGCIWNPEPGGSLGVILKLNTAWRALSEQQKDKFRAVLQNQWGPTSIDTTYPGMVRVANRDYVSNAYGLRRSSITRKGS